MSLPAPIAYWPFNEGTGTTSADASGNGHTATLSHGTWDASLKAYGASALANTDGGYGASMTAIALGTVYSIAFWMNGWDGSNDGVSLGGPSNNQYATYINSTDLYHQVGTSNFVSRPNGGLTGFNHLVITRNGTTVTFYKNGTSLGSQTLGSNTALTLNTISGYADGSFPLVVTLDEIRLYSVELTSAQVTELFALNPDGGTIVRVQTAPQVVTTASPTVAVTFSAPPVIGNGVVVPIISATVTSPMTGVTDNQGNTYTAVSAHAESSLPNTASIYYCPALTATGTPFTITGTGSTAYRLATAIEVQGPLLVDQTIGANGASAIGSTGATPTLTGTEVFVVAVLGTASSAPVTMTTSTPVWRQEAEELSGTARGEVDSRTVTGTVGTTQAAAWTLNGANYWTATLAAFRAGVPSGVHLLVGGVERRARRGTLRLLRRVNVRPTFEIEVVSVDGSYRPAEADPVELVQDGVTIYGGRVQHPATAGVDAEPITAISTRIDCRDNQALADDLYLTTTFPGGTLKAFLQWVITGYLTAKGTTLDPSQATGPTLPARAFTYRSNIRVSDGLTNACAVAVGWSWTISASNVLSASAPNAVAAPFNLSPGDHHAIGDVALDVTSEQYANRIIVLGNQSVILYYKDDFTALTNGVRVTFPLTLTPTGVDSGGTRLPNAGVVWIVANAGYEVAETFGLASATWIYDPVANTITDLGNAGGTTVTAYRTFPLPTGRPMWIIYDGTPAATGMAENVPAQAPPRGVVERILSSDLQDTASLNTIAAAELVKALARPQTVTYETDTVGLAPGQTQSINVPQRSINGTFVLQQIETRDPIAKNPDATPRLRHTVTAVEYIAGATVYPGTVGDLFTAWSTAGGSTTPAVSGGSGGGATAAHHATHEHGGSDVVLFPTGVFERSRTVPLGEWQAITFNAANFFATGGGTWTVDATAVATNRYTLIGRTLHWQIYLSWFSGTNVVAGVVSDLNMNVPGGFTVQSTTNPVGFAVDGGVYAQAYVVGNGASIGFRKTTGANFTAGSIGLITMMTWEV